MLAMTYVHIQDLYAASSLPTQVLPTLQELIQEPKPTQPPKAPKHTQPPKAPKQKRPASSSGFIPPAKFTRSHGPVPPFLEDA